MEIPGLPSDVLITAMKSESHGEVRPMVTHLLCKVLTLLHRRRTDASQPRLCEPVQQTIAEHTLQHGLDITGQ